MRGAFFLMIIFILQTKIPNYQEFIHKFSKIDWDENGSFLTRQFNAKSFLDLESEYELLSDAESYFYICDQDSSNFFYEYDLYHMEEGYLIEHVKKKYKHYPILSIDRGNYNLIMFSKYDRQNRHYYLKSFNKSGDVVDTKLVNQVIFDNVESKPSFQFSLITQDGFKIFDYQINDEISEMQTKVKMADYKIDSLGYFKLVSEDSTFLKKSINNYDEFIHMPEGDDPARKYWTLW